MNRGRLRIPLKLAVVVVGATLGCGSSPLPVRDGALVADGGASTTDCPSDWFCTSDMARATLCLDGVDGRFAVMDDGGSFCEAPV